MKRVLLICGILSSLWYIAVNIYVPMQYEGYSISSFTVSELSAIDAPTRKLWMMLVVIYPLLMLAFGFGILKSAKANRALRIVGFVIIFYSLFNAYWPPMHQRGITPALTDTLHIVWASVTVVLMLVMMGFGMTSLGKIFRSYTLISIFLLVLFGALTSREAPNIPTNGPTPWIGIWERINIGIFLTWIIVLAILLLRKENDR